MSGYTEGWRLSAGDEHQVFDGAGYPLCRIPVGGLSGRTFAQGVECARLIAAAPMLLEALVDALSGWRYIREQHGDLYGVGWDRVENAARAAIAAARKGDPA